MPHVSELLWYILCVGVIGVSALLIGVYVSRALRRRLLKQHGVDAFTIEDLRQMRAAGKITQQEYEAMRATVIGQMGADLPGAARRSEAAQAPRSPDAESPDQQGDGPPDADEK